MLKKWLERIRQKSDQQQKTIALSVSFCITAAIFSIWLFNLLQTQNPPENVATTPTENVASPVASAKNLMKNLFDFKSWGKEVYEAQ